VLEADAVIDLALMKTHEFAMFSGAIKNLFGCVPSKKKIYSPLLERSLLSPVHPPQATAYGYGCESSNGRNGPTKGKLLK